MANQYLDLVQKIFDVTNGGSDIIIDYYPQSACCLGTKKKFSLRSESDPSACWYQPSGTNKWCITDFGADGKAKDAIAITMEQENLEWYPTVNYLAQKYHLITGKGDKQQFIIEESLGPNDEAGDFSYREIPMDSHDFRYWGQSVKLDHLTELGWVRVAETRKVYHDKVIIKKGYDLYPIYIRKCLYLKEDGTIGFFYKIYEPLNRDKGYRFRYEGEKQPNYINGLYEAQRKHEEESNKGLSPDKCASVCIVCGERDAAVALSFGCKPIWFNSESDFPKNQSVIDQLRSLGPKLYFIPDIDATGIKKGRELALRFPDLHTVWLPQEMKSQKDWRNSMKKDLRDWAGIHGNGFISFHKMLSTAKTADYFDRDEKGKLYINIERMHYFLSLNGFGSYTFVEGNDARLGLARRVGCSMMEVKQSAQVVKFLEDALPYDKLRNQKYNLIAKNQKLFSLDSLSSMDTLPYKLTKPNKNVERVYFQNCVIEVTADGFKSIPADSFEGMTYESDVVKHDFKLPKEMPIIIDYNDPEDPKIVIKDIKSHLLRLLINMSRVHWNDEFTASGLSYEDFYNTLNGIIDSEYLTPEQKQEHWDCLLNKIYAIGFMISTYKKRSEAFSPYFLDLYSKGESSNGRTGKGTLFQLIKEMAHMEVFDGRNKSLTDYTHAFDRVTYKTRRILIDDFNPKVNSFDALYNKISDDMIVNPKGKQQLNLSFDESPKIFFSSNFILPNSDASTEGRVLYIPVSDWYHKATSSNIYLHDHTPYNDFGKNLGQDYSEAEWNEDHCILLFCLHFFLKMSRNGIKFTAPVQLLTGRKMSASYTQQFDEWFKNYLTEDMIGFPIVRSEMMQNYKTETGDYQMSAQMFGKAVRSWIAVNGYELNKDMKLDTSNRYMKHSPVTNSTVEHYVITRRRNAS